MQCTRLTRGNGTARACPIVSDTTTTVNRAEDSALASKTIYGVRLRGLRRTPFDPGLASLQWPGLRAASSSAVLRE